MTHTALHSAQEGPYSPAPLPTPTLGQLDAVVPAFWPITVELGYHGIFIPDGAVYHRQTCPHCSAWRVKSYERCLVTWVNSQTSADVICHHCGYEERITA